MRRVGLEPKRNFMVDVFLTHTCTEDYNKWYRKRQVKELVDHVKVSDARAPTFSRSAATLTSIRGWRRIGMRRLRMSLVISYFHI